MRAITWLLKLAFFMVALWFALKNTAPVSLYFTSALRWDEVPLILIIVVALSIGALLGAAASAPMLFRLRRELARVKSAQDFAPEESRRAERLAEAARSAGAVAQVSPEHGSA